MSRYSEHNIAPHPPLAHKYYHKDERVPCGCATDVRQAPTVVCKYCGAVYDWNAVVSFLSFRCYDCGRYEYDWHKRVASPPVEWVDKGIPMSVEEVKE